MWNSNPVQTTATATNLIANNYSVTVTDVNNCTVVESITITEPPTGMTINAVTLQNVTCNAGSDGIASYIATGAVGTTTANWSNTFTVDTITTLTAGTYTVTVTDGNGCTAVDSTVVTEPTAIVLNASAVDALCNGTSTGVGTATATGGTGTLTFNWGATATALPAGLYVVTATDAAGCTATETVTVGEPIAMTTTIVTDNAISCNSSSDELSVVTTGGVAPYTYAWSDGQNTVNAVNLTSGTYTVTVTDFNGCTSVATFNFVAPSAVDVSIQSVTDVLCFGDNTGEITASATGGTTPYNITWNNSQQNLVATNLIAGNYVVTVQDNNGCIDTAHAVVNQPLAGINTTTQLDQAVSCNGGTDGEVSVTASAGTAPYNYIWSNVPSSTTAAILA